jgi:hypothetical protein
MVAKFDYEKLDIYSIVYVIRLEIKEANKMTIYKREIQGLLIA